MGLFATSGACSPNGGSEARLDPNAVALQKPFSSASVDAVIRALAVAGVSVYASPDAVAPLTQPDSPTGPLHLLAWQARDLAIEATTPGAGLDGYDLDTIAPVSSDEVPTSYLVSAYVKSGRTHSSEFARDLLGRQDWVHPGTITFPTLVLVLFIADAARAAQEGQAASDASPSVQLLSLSSLCTTLVSWVDQVFSSIFNLLQVAPSGNAFLNFLATVWNGGVALLEQAVKGVISAFTAPIEAAIRTIIATIGIAAEARSFLVNVKVNLTANPVFNSYSNHAGSVTATLGDPNAADWPQELSACLSAFNVQLPPLNGANHDPVTWIFTSMPPGAATITAKQSNLDGKNMARLDYLTGQDIPQCFRRPDDVIKVTVIVHRVDKQKLIDFLVSFLGGQFAGLGDIIGPVVGPPLRKLLADVIGPIAALADMNDTRFVRIEHQVLPSPACATPTPTPTSSPPATPSHRPPAPLGACPISAAEAGPNEQGGFVTVQFVADHGGASDLYCNYIVGGPGGVALPLHVLTFSSTADAQADFADLANLNGASFTIPSPPGSEALISAEQCAPGAPAGACSFTAVGVSGFRVVWLIRAPADEAATVGVMDLILARVGG